MILKKVITLWILALSLISCVQHSDCDQKIKSLYPCRGIKTIDTSEKIIIYWLDDNTFVECNYTNLPLEINARKPLSWENGYCNPMASPERCLKQLQGKEKKEQGMDEYEGWSNGWWRRNVWKRMGDGRGNGECGMVGNGWGDGNENIDGAGWGTIETHGRGSSRTVTKDFVYG